jgi:uncharacterized membrane protein YsdA (DUF1294 family)
MHIAQISPTLFLLIVANVFSMLFFGIDKLMSIKGGWRIPESRLILVALCGPFGAYAGMLLFRHKIRKAKFVLVPISLLVHLFLILYFKLA